MTASLYLDMLDETLRAGLQGLSPSFVDAQVRFVIGCQQSDGGFRGRQGGSDPYYTDFALRCLALLAPDHPAVARVRDYLKAQANPPLRVVECFNLLNIARMLRLPLPRNSDAAEIRMRMRESLKNHLLPRGGLARSPGELRISVYHTFLGALCFAMLDDSPAREAMPTLDGAVYAVQALGRSDGGYAELDGQSASQTSATAAAVAFLTMHDALPPGAAASATRFLAAMQCDDGGLKAHAAVPVGDLLSTFTGMITLTALGGLHAIDVSRTAQFLRGMGLSDGGFLACSADDAADVEYTYYGLGVLAILRTSAVG